MKRILATLLILGGLVHPGRATTLLKEDTSVTVQIGPFVDAVDGATIETGLGDDGGNIETNIRLSKAGGAFAARNSTTDPTYDTAGFYRVELDATDTSTPGELLIECSDPTTYLPVWHRFMVVPANSYDSLVVGNVKLQVDVAQFGGSATPVTNIGTVFNTDFASNYDATNDVWKSSVTHWLGTAAATPTVAGVPEIDLTHWNGTAIPGVDTAGYPKVTIKDGVGAGELKTYQGRARAHGSWLAIVSGINSTTNFNIALDDINPPSSFAGMVAIIYDASFTSVQSVHRIVSGNATSLVIDSAPNFTVAGGDSIIIQAVPAQVAALPSATAGAANGLLISGSNSGTTTLGALTVTGATTHTGNVALQNGLTVTRSSANQPAIEATGNGTGSGIKLASSDTGSGLQINGGSISGDGVKIFSIEGHGVNINAIGTSKHGLLVAGGSGGTSDGIKVVAGTGGVPIRGDIAGNITGNLSGSIGSVATGGITAGSFAANAIDAAAIAADAGVELGTANWATTVRQLSGTQTFNNTGTWTGNLSGSVGSVTGAVGSVTGNVGGDVAGTIGGFATTSLANLFDTNSGKVYADAVAGSVVKEIADHATTPSLTAGGIADAVLDELLVGHTTAGSLSKAVSDIYDFLNDAPTFSSAMDGQGYTMALASKLDTNVDAKISEIPAKMPSLLLTTTIDGTPSSPTSLVLADGPPDNDALNGALVIVTDSVDDTQKAVGLVKDYDELTQTITLVADPGIFDFAAGDTVDVIASGAAIPLWLSGP